MRAAIIGIGAIAKMHARALADIPGVKLVAATCRTEEKGQAFATEFGCQWYGDTGRMLRREKPDFVTVATPSGAHLPAVLTALRRGVHVICEKPLEISLARIDRMIAAAGTSAATLGAIFPQRFNPVVRAVHEAAAAGRFGTLAVAASSVPWWRDDAYYGPGRWQGTKALDGGGALMNQSIHGVDALQWIAGATMPGLAAGENPVESVMAMTAVRAHDAERLEVEDTCVAILRFKTVPWANSSLPPASFRVSCGGYSSAAATAPPRSSRSSWWRGGFAASRPMTRRPGFASGARAVPAAGRPIRWRSTMPATPATSRRFSRPSALVARPNSTATRAARRWQSSRHAIVRPGPAGSPS